MTTRLTRRDLNFYTPCLLRSDRVSQFLYSNAMPMSGSGAHQLVGIAKMPLTEHKEINSVSASCDQLTLL